MRTFFRLSLYILIFICFVSCDNGTQNTIQDTQQETGSISVQMLWATESKLPSEPYRAAIDCSAMAITTLSADVYSSGETVSHGGPWDCSQSHGKINQVPAGDNRLVVLQAYDANGNEIYRGEKPDVSVKPNEQVNITLTMVPVIVHSVSLVEDINPGIDSSFPHHLSNLEDKLLFVASDTNQGFELFISQAANQGAQLLKNIYPFDDVSDRSGLMAPSEFVELNGRFYFRGNDGSGYRIWRTNGHTANTEAVATSANYANPTELTVLNNQIFFAADSSAAGRELWYYDESTGQAQLVYDIMPGTAGSNPKDLTAVGDELYYVADDGQHGYEIWRTDPAADTTALANDLYVGAQGSFPTDLLEINGRLFFVAYNGGQHTDRTPPTFGAEVWMLLPSPDGNVELQLTADLNPVGSSEATNLTNINGTTLAFSGYEPSTGKELYLFNWETDTQPQRITDLNPNAASSHPANFVVSDDILYFTAHNLNGTEHIWMYALDRLQSVRCVTAAFPNIYPRDLTIFSDYLYFSGFASGARKLWVADGSRVGLVIDTNGGATKSSPANTITFSERMYFTAYDAEHGEEVFQLTTQ